MYLEGFSEFILTSQVVTRLPTKLWEGNVFSRVCPSVIGSHCTGAPLDMGPHCTGPLPPEMGPHCTVLPHPFHGELRLDLSSTCEDFLHDRDALVSCVPTKYKEF